MTNILHIYLMINTIEQSKKERWKYSEQDEIHCKLAPTIFNKIKLYDSSRIGKYKSMGNRRKVCGSELRNGCLLIVTLKFHQKRASLT